MTLANGASVNESPASINATGFVLKPDGTVVISVYSRGAIGRLVPTDTLQFIKRRQQASLAQ